MKNDSGSGRRSSGLQLQPVSTRSRIVCGVLTFALPVALSIIAPLFSRDASTGAHWIHEALGADATAERWLDPLLVAAVAGAIWLLLDRLLLRHDLRLDANGIDIRTTMYRRRVAFVDLDLASARVIDVDEHAEAKPLFKSNGLSVPGFRSGWFRSRTLAKLFVATAGGSRLLWLPTRLGYTLLLQPENPVALLEEIRRDANPAVGSPARSARLG